MAISAKIRVLERSLAPVSNAVVAFSGGADSAFLAEMSHRVLGASSFAVTADSPSLKRSEMSDARRLAEARGWRHQVIQTDEMTDERYATNPVDRCYWCKAALMERLVPFALLGWTVMLGTNLDDLRDHRPGQRAATDAGAVHPLVEAGFTKADVREASLLIGLSTHDKPAQACLASRIAHGVRVTTEALGRVERAEDALAGLGFRVIRVRDLGADACSVEVDPELVEEALKLEQRIVASMKACGFKAVQIDERGYRMGSMSPLVQIGRGPHGA